MALIFRILVGLAGLGLTALILIAVRDGDFSSAGGWLTADPWGRVTLADLYLGFLIAAGLIALVERRLVMMLVWILPMPILGNVWAALWIVVRWRAIRKRLGAVR